jgi:hypothetical protein
MPEAGRPGCTTTASYRGGRTLGTAGRGRTLRPAGRAGGQTGSASALEAPCQRSREHP